ncbi:hypothetical protein [Brevundimonas sp.]|uniref:hypothetical protein n=1 Tax=Brevundimonas sp. TaxID=1871086 RepID=UPI003BA929F9
MQETDFPAADGFAPIDPPILLGFDPVFLIGLMLLLLAIAAGMYLLGRRHGGRAGGSDDAPAEIHGAVLKRSRRAMAADSNDLRGRVQDLRDLIERLLGPVLVLNKGLSGALKDLDAALKGEIKDEHGHPEGHGGGHGAGHKPAHDDHPPAGGTAASGGGGAAASSTIAVIGLPIHIHAAPEPTPAHAAHGHGEHHARTMTHDEQTSALALSVRKFNDYWSKSDLRIRELRAARAALSRRPPQDLSSGAETRVWDRS